MCPAKFQVVKLFGIVASTPDFKEQHLVMNGCSDVVMQVRMKPHCRFGRGLQATGMAMEMCDTTSS